MSHREALDDKIPFRDCTTGRYYYPPCQYCGGRVASWAYKHGVRYTCSNCREARKNAKKNLK